MYEALNMAVLERVPLGAQRILDLGCGTGALGAALKGDSRRKIVGVTHSPAEAAVAEARLDQVIVSDLEEIQPETLLEQFDLVICSHVLEHLRDPSRLLRALKQNFLPHGRIIVALPNILHFKQRILFLKGHFKYTDGGLMDRTHLRFYDWDTAGELLTGSGYRIQSATAAGHIPLPLVRRLLPSASTAADDLALKAFPGLFGNQFILIAEPN